MGKDELEKKRLIEANLIVVKGRWFYVSAVVLTGLITKLQGGPNANFPLSYMIVIACISLTCNLFYLWYFKHANNKTFFGVKITIFSQWVFEFILWTIVIYYAGGVISGSFIYFIYTIIASAFIYSFWGVTLIATLYSLAYSGLILAEYFRIIPHISRYDNDIDSYIAFDKATVYANIFAVVTSFYIAGFFCGLIAKSLRKKEKEIIYERDKIKSIISSLNDGLIFIDNHDNVDLINRKMVNLLGCKKENVLNKNINSLNRNKFSILNKIVNKNLLDEKKELIELDSGITLEASAYDVKSKDDKYLGRVKIARDVSREKFLNKMKSEFITIAGHQFRTPLSAIKIALSSIINNDYGKVKKEQLKILQKSYEYTEKLIQLINDFLSISSAEEGKYNYQFKKINLIESLKEVTDRLKSEANIKDIRFNITIEDNIPEISADVEKIKLAIGAIMDNAIEYTPKDGEVNISYFVEDNKLLIIIKDTGIGILPEDKEKVFTKFFRSEDAFKFHTEGNGLNLYVAKNIIENHQGEIWFKSEYKEGTEFYIELPFEQNIK